MKKAEVKVGGTYAAKVSGKVVPVRIDAENPRGGWNATNTATGKKVRIKSAQRLRGAVHPGTATRRAVAGKSKPMALAIPSQAGEGEAKAARGAPDATRANVGREGASQTGTKAAKKAKAPREKKPSLLDLAAEVLAKAKEPMDCKAIVEKVLASGRWQTKGKTPAATLYSAILRHMQKKGKDARFKKVGRGQFALARKES